MEIISIIMTIILTAIIVLFIMMMVWWYRPFKALTWLCHDIMGWHKPSEKYDFDGCSNHSICRLCGKEIMQDSQGNWF